MFADFSLIYEQRNEYAEKGYHTTLIVNKKDIIEKGFDPSNEKDDWLGEGVYFWDNIKDAKWWKGSNKKESKCIFICDLKCNLSNYLDLDIKREMDKFDVFSKQYVKEMVESTRKKPFFKNNNQRRKFFCDIYCSKNNISILSFTFEHAIVNKAGFKTGTLNRRQICVRDPKCISIVSIKE